MCIAIMKPKDKTISKDRLKTCCDNNKDGMGFAYVDRDRIIIKKFMNFDDFYKAYSEVQNKSNMLIHFRIATHGKVEVNNCHPFKLNDHMALIHNGIISGYGDKEKITDTQDFINKVIGKISYKMWKNPSYRELVGDAIGYSKFVVLDTNDNVYIINEDKGVWDDGIWYSNSSYKPKDKPLIKYIGNNYQSSIWDMYGNETYDSWYKRTHGTDDSIEVSAENDTKIIYKCKKCGKVITLPEDDDEPVCDSCGSKKLNEIGIVFDDEVYYYDEIELDEVNNNGRK